MALASRVLPPALAALLVCSCSGPALPRVEGEFGSAPVVQAPVPVSDEAAYEVVVEGAGPAAGEGGFLAADVVNHPVEASGELGEAVFSSFEEGVELLFTGAEFAELFPDGGDPDSWREGTRLVLTLPGDTAGQEPASEGPPPEEAATVSVIDIVGAYPAGTTADGAPVPGADTLGVDVDAPRRPRPADPGAEPPGELGRSVLIDGSGAPVGPKDRVVVQFSGAGWSSGEVFDSTWAFGGRPVAFSLAADPVIEGWKDGLPGVRAGSRVLLVVPPGQGYGSRGNPDAGIAPDETLVYVVDVLGVH